MMSDTVMDAIIRHHEYMRNPAVTPFYLYDVIHIWGQFLPNQFLLLVVVCVGTHNTRYSHRHRRHPQEHPSQTAAVFV